MRLIFLCAAATPGLRRGIFPHDEALDARGRALATHCASLLPRAQIYWTSPTPHAAETATALGWAATQIDPLRECDYASWAGQDLRDVEMRDPKGYGAWLKDPAASPHGGESIIDLIARVGAWLDGLHNTADTMVVAPASVIRAAIIHAWHAAALTYGQIDVAPLTLTELRRDLVGWTVGAISTPAGSF